MTRLLLAVIAVLLIALLTVGGIAVGQRDRARAAEAQVSALAEALSRLDAGRRAAAEAAASGKPAEDIISGNDSAWGR